MASAGVMWVWDEIQLHHVHVRVVHAMLLVTDTVGNRGRGILPIIHDARPVCACDKAGASVRV